jgi:HK97 gp10 family phage protein
MASVKVKIEGIEQTAEELKTVYKKIGQTQFQALYQSANLVRNTAIKLIQKTSQGETYVRKASKHTASKPGDAPNTDTGRLVGSIKVYVGENHAEVKSDLDYAFFLEFGTKDIEPRPFLSPAIEMNQKKINEIFGREIKVVVGA